MSNHTQYEYLYTEDGKVTPKWRLVGLVLVAYALFCLGLAVYLSTHPLLSAESGPLGTTASPTAIFDGDTPDFSGIDDVTQRKQAFFEFLIPFIRQENAAILEERQRLLAVKESLEDQKRGSETAISYLSDLSDKYRVDTEELSVEQQINRLLLRVDKLPVSMVLAQAAMESAWGTSRFVKTGNNFFGEWCFTEGCGTVPLRRAQGKYHEVANFDSARDSLRSYFQNINTHRAYRGVRERRAALREADRDIRGLQLIEGLHSYSAKGEDYIAELRQIIRGNQLMELDQPPQTAEN